MAHSENRAAIGSRVTRRDAWGSWGSLARVYIGYVLVVGVAFLTSQMIGSFIEDQNARLVVILGIPVLVAVVAPCFLAARRRKSGPSRATEAELDRQR